MHAANYNQTTLAEAMGVTPQAVQQWVSGGTVPKGTRLLKLSRLLNVDLNWLLTGSTENVRNLSSSTDTINFDKQSKKVPLITFNHVRQWCQRSNEFATANVEKWLECPMNHGPRTFALQVSGDSMTNPFPGRLSYPEGVFIYVDPDRRVSNGCRVIARLPETDSITFKEYREEGGKKFLKPLNPQYPTQEISDETIICGVVIGQFIPE